LSVSSSLRRQFTTTSEPAALRQVATSLPSLPLIPSTPPDEPKPELSHPHRPKRQKPEFANTRDAQATTRRPTSSALWRRTQWRRRLRELLRGVPMQGRRWLLKRLFIGAGWLPYHRVAAYRLSQGQMPACLCSRTESSGGELFRVSQGVPSRGRTDL
jgi:hypothetical protein